MKAYHAVLLYYFTFKMYHLISYSAGIDFRRQNLTSKDNPRIERVKTFQMSVDP